jgi:hypothetical protein
MYEKRYVAFIDILGFSELIRRIDAKPELLDKILKALIVSEQFNPLIASMNSIKEEETQDAFKSMICISAFSDNIVISTKNNNIGLGLITISTEMLCTQLLDAGIFTRGALCSGKLHHENSTLFGTGLVNAYELESKAAVYPRVIIEDQLIPNITQCFQKQPWPNPLRRDFDGLWHLHLLDPKLAKVLQGETKPGETPKPTYIPSVRIAIEEALRRANTVDVLAKIRWFGNYFNDIAHEAGEEPIQLDIKEYNG